MQQKHLVSQAACFSQEKCLGSESGLGALEEVLTVRVKMTCQGPDQLHWH